MAQNLAPAIIRLNDDIIEYIAEVSLRDADGRCENRKVRALSQVCQRWRVLILGRASFWNDLTVPRFVSISAVRTIVERSRGTPLHISIHKLSQLYEHELLQHLPAGRLLGAFSVKLSFIGDPTMESLGLHWQTGELPQLHKLEVVWCLCTAAFHLIGPKLVFLFLVDVNCHNPQELAAALRRATNLESLRLTNITFRVESSSEPYNANIARRSPSVLEINANLSYSVSRILMDLVSQLYPLVLSNGASVELRSRDESAFAELNLLRFSRADRLVLIGQDRYLVSYPANTFDHLRPTFPWIPPRFSPYFVGNEAVYRGFDCDNYRLEHPGIRRQTVCHILATVRSIVLSMSTVKEVIKFFVNFENETFALVEDIQFLLQVSVQDTPRISVQPEGDAKRVACPRLKTLMISIDAIDHLSRDHMDFKLVGHLWGNHCEALIDLLEVPPGVMLTIHAQCDGVSYADTIVKKLSPDGLGRQTAFTFSTAKV